MTELNPVLSPVQEMYVCFLFLDTFVVLCYSYECVMLQCTLFCEYR